MRRRSAVAAVVVGFFWAAMLAPAQEPAPPPSSGMVLMSPGDLDQLLGPIALYPDPLLSELLPAATLPAQIVLADRQISQNPDPGQIDAQPWDPSIKAIAHYPELLKWLDDNLNWTTEVGQAFLNQQQDVMDSIQRLRGKAQVLGNLQDSPQETIVNDDGEIEIQPTQPDQIYLPVYQPDLIYDQPGIYCSFGVGWGLGGWLVYDWDWRQHRIITWGPGHARPGNWWHLPPRQRIGQIARVGGQPWRPAGRTYASVARAADRGWAPADNRGNFAQGNGRGIVRPATLPPAAGGFQPRPGINNRAGFERPSVEARNPVESHPPAESRAPAQSFESHPAFEARGSSGVGVFGGPQSSSEARASSARGAESRGESSGGGGGRRR